jgi:bloom syndrome protein
MVLSDKTMNEASVSVHMNNLYRVVQYCENQTECRRAQLLEYFGETGFNSAKCRENRATICDNCSCSGEMVEMDVTQTAKLIVESVNTLIHRGSSNWRRPMAQLTLKHLVDVFKVGCTHILIKC